MANINAHLGKTPHIGLDCTVTDEYVYVEGDVRVSYGSTITDRCAVRGVRRKTYIESSHLKDRSSVYDSTLYNCNMSGYATVNGGASLSSATVAGEATVGDNASIAYACIGGQATVYRANVNGRDSYIFGPAYISGDYNIGDHARIFDSKHVLVVNGMFDDTVTVYRSIDGTARVQAGCQNFLLSESVESLEQKFADHGWNIPRGWRSLRKALLKASEHWAEDKPSAYTLLDAGFAIPGLSTMGEDGVIEPLEANS